MMILRLLCAVLSLGALVAGCRQPEIAAGSSALATMTASHGQAVYTFAVTGMHCKGCVGGLLSELARIPGVAQASADLATARARVLVATNRVSVPQLVVAVEEAGFKAELAPP